MLSPTRYAKSGDIHIAYQVGGQGPIDLVVVPGFASHLEWFQEEPAIAHCFARLAAFSRLIVFDKRGTGLSDPTAAPASLEERMDDVRAVMDAVGSKRAAIVGISEGGALAALFAAQHPARTSALVMYGSYARGTWSPDYPWGATAEQFAEVEGVLDRWGEGVLLSRFAPSRVSDQRLRAWWAQLQRLSASPGMIKALYKLFPEIDVRSDPAVDPRADAGAQSKGRSRHPGRRGPLHRLLHPRGQARRARGRRPPLLARRQRRRARRDRGVPHRRSPRPRPGTGAADAAVHRHRRLHRPCGRARRPALAGAARAPPCARAPPARALRRPRSRHRRRRFLRGVRRSGPGGPLRPGDLRRGPRRRRGGAGRPAHRRMRAGRNPGARDRRPHRRARRRDRGSGRGPRVEHGQGPGGGIGLALQPTAANGRCTAWPIPWRLFAVENGA